MAKRKTKTSAGGKLSGKSVALVGKFGYSDMQRSHYANQITRAGGVIVDPAKTMPDLLVVGEGRGGKPPGDVAKLQKKSPEIEVLSAADLIRLALPDREELLKEIAHGRRENHDRFWDELQHSCFQAAAQIDLSKADLRKADLYGAHLESVLLTGSDLRGANTEYTHFGDLEKVDFDGCVSKNVYLVNVKSCTFRAANLERAWMFYGYGPAKRMEKCDFTKAKMNGARLGGGVVVDCKFADADLSDAQMEKSIFERTDFTKADLCRIHAAEARLDGAKLAKANLNRADLRKASLKGADLRNANLREAVLSEADLTGANIAGADFQDAVLTGANLQGLDFSKAKNFTPPVARTTGPKVLELAAAAAGAKSFVTSAEVDLGKDEFACLQIDAGGSWANARSIYRREGNHVYDNIRGATVEQAMLALADRWPNATLRLDSITVKGSKTVRGAKLKELAAAAWAEAFGVAAMSPEELKAQRDQQEGEALRERDALMKKIRDKGADVWNKIDYRLRDRVDVRGADLSGATLDKLSMGSRDLQGASFAGSSLVGAELWNGKMKNAVFTGANLQGSKLGAADLTGANFRDANLTGADLHAAKLLGADFTGAQLKDANFSQAHFDDKTVFPSGFKPPDNMAWKGDGPRPGAKKPKKAAKAGSVDFETFLQQLNNKVEAARMQKAGAMLKAERFQLFAEVKDDSLIGVVKSQSSKELVYSCRLASDGAFGCCTQNLRPCGGLRGALCKHLLVLIVGLAKAGQLDPATVDHWIELSRGKKPAIDEEAMSATFLRYKGAEAGEVDWRPTETIPEDFYAM